MKWLSSTAEHATNLPSWEDEMAVVAARAREAELNTRQAELRDRVTALRRPSDGGLIAIPSPSHPSWPVQTQYEAAHGEWQEAHRELAKREAQAQAESAIVGYRIGQDFFASEIEPLVQQLQQVLARYERLQYEVLTKTAARLPGLGRIELRASAIDEWTQNARRNFG